MPIRTLDKLLDSRNIPFRSYNHPPTYTAQETAEVLHTTGYEVAKSVVLKVDNRFVITVLPACQQVDLEGFRQKMDARTVKLATEKELQSIAPMCDKGSIPPVGNLFGLPVYVATSLAEDEVISFSGGTHTEDIRMSFRDFEWLVQPQLMDFILH
jgi:Ala-tRNA(Pro) deacylase